LPKAQRTRGLSSYHKFKHKSWPNFIFRISTKHQLQNHNETSASPQNLSFKILAKLSFRISTKIQLHNLYKTSAEKNWPNSSFTSCLDFEICKNCCQHDPLQQQLQHQQVFSWNFHMPGLHQSSLLNSSEWVSQSVTDKGKQWSDSGPIKRNNCKRIDWSLIKVFVDNLVCPEKLKEGKNYACPCIYHHLWRTS